jgi:uncharacterized protein (TIGR02594 family)
MTSSSDTPFWLAKAWFEFGQREVPGAADNARIVAMFADAGHARITDDAVAWCAAYAGAVLKRAGVAPTGSLMARSYLNWGTAISESRPGAIAVFSRGADPAAGHVGFLLGETESGYVVLGGNQSDAVGVDVIARERLLGLRWPIVARSNGSPANAAIFSLALAHVLKMEGGFSDDPLDTGGPTNKGLTLADLAHHRGIALDDWDGRPQLLADLKAISDAELRAIYFDLYWAKASCAALPPALALFHFDTAVNMGNGTAIRMLQTALGVTIDGEIGPETARAAQQADPASILSIYADLRRRRYRSLGAFARFGRGWLNRVDRTLATAIDIPVPSTPTQGPADVIDKSATTCTTNPASNPISNPTATSSADSVPKWWGNSLTVWGAIVTGLAAVLPAIGPAVGVEIPREAVTDSAEQVAAILQAATGLAGTLITIFGRARAVRPLARREMTFKI